MVSGVFITVREREFTGEDMRLAGELTRRIDPPMNLAAGFSSNATMFLPDMEPPAPESTPAPAPDPTPAHADTNSSWYNISKFLGSGRRQVEPIYVTNLHVHKKILDMMRQHIYSARYRIEILEHILNKYQSDERFRISYIFAKLGQWEKEIRGIYQAAQFYQKTPVHKHIYYYEHILRRQVDVTYSLQFLYTLHFKFMEQYKQIMFGGGKLEWSKQDIDAGLKDKYDKYKTEIEQKHEQG